MTQIRISELRARVGRKKEFTERVLSPLRPGTLARIAAVLEVSEDRTEFVRQALEREIKRRERKGYELLPSRRQRKHSDE